MNKTFDELFEAVWRVEAMLKQILHKPAEKEDNKDNEILDVKQAAALLKYSVRTVYAKAEQGIIPAFKQGNRWYFFKNELLDWVKAGKAKTDADILADVDRLLTSKRRRA